MEGPGVCAGVRAGVRAGVCAGVNAGVSLHSWLGLPTQSQN